MGVSAEACLYYGIPVGSDSPLRDYGEDGREDDDRDYTGDGVLVALGRTAGIADPHVPDSLYREDPDGWQRLTDGFRALLEAKAAELGLAGLELGVVPHPVTELKRYYLHFRGTDSRAYPGDAQRVWVPAVAEGTDERLLEAARLLGLPEAEPGWYLAAGVDY